MGTTSLAHKWWKWLAGKWKAFVAFSIRFDESLGPILGAGGVDNYQPSRATHCEYHGCTFIVTGKKKVKGRYPEEVSHNPGNT